jgi:hypothetical protein
MYIVPCGLAVSKSLPHRAGSALRLPNKQLVGRIVLSVKEIIIQVAVAPVVICHNDRFVTRRGGGSNGDLVTVLGKLVATAEQLLFFAKGIFQSCFYSLSSVSTLVSENVPMLYSWIVLACLLREGLPDQLNEFVFALTHRPFFGSNSKSNDTTSTGIRKIISQLALYQWEKAYDPITTT